LRITILSVGHRMPAWIQEGFNEYAKRMPPEARLELWS
jgi:23S rRNA (pseudouridine1915-N3)-methyltransferase